MNEPRVVESVTNECQSLGRAHESSSARAEQLIACLEGEIAKRDETIARLEPQLNRAIQANYDLREELSALKAQGVVILDESQEAAEFESQFQGCKAFMRDSHASEAAGKYVCQRSHMFKVWMHFRAMLAAPAAPEADAGLVEALEASNMLLRTKRHACENEQVCHVLDVHIKRNTAALAAHRSKGGV